MSANGTEWRDVVAVHPAADIFPINEDEARAIGEDIKINGLRMPFTFYRAAEDEPWVLLDGRLRATGLEMIGIEPFVDDNGWPTVTILDEKWHDATDQQRAHYLTGDEIDPVSFVMSMNVKRRHLTFEERGRYALELLKLDPTKSDRQIAKATGMSPTSAGKVRRKGETAGDVSTVDTSTDTAGRRQPRKKTAKKTAEPPVKTTPKTMTASFDRVVSDRVDVWEKRILSNGYDINDAALNAILAKVEAFTDLIRKRLSEGEQRRAPVKKRAPRRSA